MHNPFTHAFSKSLPSLLRFFEIKVRFLKMQCSKCMQNGERKPVFNVCFRKISITLLSTLEHKYDLVAVVVVHDFLMKQEPNFAECTLRLRHCKKRLTCRIDVDLFKTDKHKGQQVGPDM